MSIVIHNYFSHSIGSANNETEVVLKNHSPIPTHVNALKTPYQDGKTQVIFEPSDFIAQLAALIHKPRRLCP